MRARAVVVLVVSLMLVVVSCGVGTEDSAVRTDPDNVPFGLLAGPTTTTTSVPNGESFNVFLVSPAGLVAVPRAESGGSPVTAAIRALVEGPTTAESTGGIVSGLSRNVVESVGVRSRLATVSLGSGFEPGEGTPARMIAQIVLTLTSLGGIDRVAFELGGKAVDVPRGDGSLTSSPVRASDYAALVAATG